MKRYLFSFFAVFSLGNVLLGQEPPPAPVNAPEPIVSRQIWTAPQPSAPKSWVDAEYLLWHIRSGPLPLPVLATGDPNALPAPGAIGQPSTAVLLGNGSIGYGNASGLRVNLGSWIDCEGLFGVEATAFYLAQRRTSYSTASGADGNPPLYIPIFLPDQGREGSYAITDPSVGRATVGSFSMTSTSSLWGAEANGLANLYRLPSFKLDGLVGFRYLNLSEAITVNTNSLIVAADNGLATTDYFGARNQFYGGQLGFRAEKDFGRFSLD